MGARLSCCRDVEYIRVGCQQCVDMIHFFFSYAVYWYGPDVVNELVLFVNSVEICLWVSVFPLMFDASCLACLAMWLQMSLMSVILQLTLYG